MWYVFIHFILALLVIVLGFLLITKTMFKMQRNATNSIELEAELEKYMSKGGKGFLILVNMVVQVIFLAIHVGWLVYIN